MTTRCVAEVWIRDCLRYSGRGPGGFSMHYTEEQCHRNAKDGEYCTQHNKMLLAGRSVRRCRWAQAAPRGGKEAK